MSEEIKRELAKKFNVPEWQKDDFLWDIESEELINEFEHLQSQLTKEREENERLRESLKTGEDANYKLIDKVRSLREELRSFLPLGDEVSVVINSNPETVRKFIVTKNDNSVINLKAVEIGVDSIYDFTIYKIPTNHKHP